MDDKLLSVHEASALLGVKVGTLYQWAYERKLPTVKIGRALRFRKSVIDGIIRAGERPAVSDAPLL